MLRRLLNHNSIVPLPSSAPSSLLSISMQLRVPNLSLSSTLRHQLECHFLTFNLQSLGKRLAFSFPLQRLILHSLLQNTTFLFPLHPESSTFFPPSSLSFSVANHYRNISAKRQQGERGSQSHLADVKLFVFPFISLSASPSLFLFLSPSHSFPFCTPVPVILSEKKAALTIFVWRAHHRSATIAEYHE